MKVLVVGGGGREHSLCWKLSRSNSVSSIFCAPGNGGISDIAHCVAIRAEDIDGLVQFSKRERIDLVVVGPENPLALGIVDKLEGAGIPVFGPKKDAARIESSKAFAKNLMRKYGIPTADYRVFERYEDAVEHVKRIDPPFVIKADGLCQGKGAYVIKQKDDALSCLEDLFLRKIHGQAGERVVIEDFLSGYEVSYLAFSDGNSILSLLPSQDHKRLLDNDQGPNTGGMGAYTPLPFLGEELEERIKREIMERTILAMKREGLPYKGVLYGGLMIRDGAPYVLEFNSRFGDPEIQPILFKMESDILPIIQACIEGRLSEIREIKWREGYAICVVLASKGYPFKPETGKPIEGLEGLKDKDDVIVFHAGTKKIDGRYYTSGGRVLNVVAIGKTLQEAIDKVYSYISQIRFEGMQYRRDIGLKGLLHRA